MDFVFSSSLDMARERKSRPSGPTENIDEDARLDILARMRMHKPPMSKAELARACNVTPSAITLLLSTPIPKGETRGCRFWRQLAKTLGLLDTPSKVLVTPKDEALRRAHRVLSELSEAQLENWLVTGELLAGKR